MVSRSTGRRMVARALSGSVGKVKGPGIAMRASCRLRFGGPSTAVAPGFQPEPRGSKARDRDSESEPAGARGHAAQTPSPAGPQAPRLGCAAANAGRYRGPWGARLGSWEEGSTEPP
jgi:hypothetical protein